MKHFPLAKTILGSGLSQISEIMDLVVLQACRGESEKDTENDQTVILGCLHKFAVTLQDSMSKTDLDKHVAQSKWKHHVQ